MQKSIAKCDSVLSPKYARMPTMIKYWIFDMDGTVTVPKHDFAALRKRLQLPPGSDILKEIDAKPPEIQKRDHIILEQWEEEIAYKGEAAPDALELLKKLQTHGAQESATRRILTDGFNVTPQVRKSAASAVSSPGSPFQ